MLRDDARSVLRRANEPAVTVAPSAAAIWRPTPPLIVAKSNLRSRVHRRGYMDYSASSATAPTAALGRGCASSACSPPRPTSAPVREVPLIRRKVGAGCWPRRHRAGRPQRKARCSNIVETYPARRAVPDPARTSCWPCAAGILHLYDRPRVRLFVRRDPFDRFVSVLFFVPRERYDSRLRRAGRRILAEAFGGHVSAYYPNFSDAPLARVHFIIGVAPGAPRASPTSRRWKPQLAEAARTWEDRFEDAAARRRAARPAGSPRWRR